ncbi:MAG: hypothetical protein KOO62_01545 [candidate division Zixibacteria bacterium]|nr:hypothetical protein [candidate division Zixibacteria bacterium]
MSKYIIALVAAIVLVIGPGTRAQFQSLETENMRLLYNEVTQAYLAPHVARCFENAMKFHRELLNYTPSEKVTVTMFDIADYGNAGAAAVPENRISLLVAPISYAYETSPANERMNTFMNHELVHIVALDQATGRDKFFRKMFFGKVSETSDNPLSILYGYMTNPRQAAPRWFHEGIAVFLETWMAGGIGRVQGAYDEMVFRTMVLDSSSFYDPIGVESHGSQTDFQVGVVSYLYGTRFFSYLALHYGPESLIDWVARVGGSKAYVISQFKQVYDMGLGDAWNQWIDWEHEFQQVNLDSIRQYPITPYRDLSPIALGSLSRAQYDSVSGEIYVAVNYPGEVAHIAAISISDGSIRKLCDIKGAALYYVSAMAFDRHRHQLFYTTDNDDWRDLRVIDTRTKQTRTLQKDLRMGDLAFNENDSSLWGVRHYNGISTLTRVPYPYDDWNQIYSWPYGKDIYDLDISSDGKIVTAALSEISGRQSLIAMNIDSLVAGDSSYSTLFEFGHSIPAGFVFSDDNRFLYGSSYYSGASNIFRYDFKLDSMEALSNCETGLFHPIPVSQDSMIAFRYTRDGFLPAILPHRPLEDISAITFLGHKIAREYPIVRDWNVGSMADINLDSLTVSTGNYHALANFRLVSMYPIVEGYGEYPAYGFRVNLEEPVGFHSSDMTVSYTPNQSLPQEERWHVGWHHIYLNWQFSFNYNGADFYDLFGPTKTSRKGYSAGLLYKRTLLYDLPRVMDYRLSLTGFGGLEKMPDYQNIATTFDEFVTLNGAWTYKNRKASLGAVDHEKGILWNLTSNNTYVNRKLYSKFATRFDFGIPLSLHHSSIWLRTSAGYAPGDRDNPFANFFFGGFGNNWIDYKTEKRYRQTHAFPGVELNAIGGTNFARAVLDLNLPPIRFRHLGWQALHIMWIRCSLFSTVLSTNLDNEEYRTTYFNAGTQLDLRFKLLSRLKLTFSVGYAAGFDEQEYLSDELMVSLKVL